MVKEMQIKSTMTSSYVDEDVEKLEPLCIVDGDVKWCKHYGKRGISSKS